MADRLEFEAGFKDNASPGVKKLGKNLADIKPSHGMAAAGQWMENFRKGTDRTVGAVRPVAGLLNSVGIGGLAASLSIGELARQFKELADSTLTLKELSRQSRISEDDLRRLRYAGERFHLNPDAVNGAINSWSAQMVGFRMHTSKFYNELATWNRDVAQKIASESPIEGLKSTLDYISRIKDPQVRKMWAEDAGVGDMLPMMNRGPDGLSAIFADAARQVAPVSKEMQEAADRFNTSTTNFNQTWDNFKNDIGPSVLDPMSHMLDRLDEAMRWAAKYPGDASAAAAIVAGAFATFWLRARIMRGSALAGGGPMGAAAGELSGAAQKQIGAGTSLIEAATALKEAAAELRGRGGSGPGGDPVKEPEKDGESLASKLKNAVPSLAIGGTLAAVFGGITWAMLNRNQSKSLVDGGRPDVKPSDNYSGLPGVDDDAERRLLPPSASDQWQHPDDDRLSRARPDDFKRYVQEGSKQGIVEGLREMAQQADLAGGDAGNPLGVKSSSGGLGGSGKHFGGGSSFAGASLGDHARGGIGRGAAGMAPSAREAFEFWKSKGLTPEQAAGLVGMEQGEAGFDSNNKTGDGGSAHGAFQWHAPRRAAILRGTGIDIDHSTHRQQLEAAYWEFTQGNDPQARQAWDAVRRGKSATDAARSGVYLFERPGDKRGQSIVRGGMAEGWLKRFSDEDAKAKGTPGAGTPAPSGAAVSDAEVFAARQRILNGGRNPADRALVDRYKAQQAQPEHHAAGGPIRGPGGPRSDSIPAWLSNGEFVVNAAAAGPWLPFLHAINSGHMFADGGLVAAGMARHRSWQNFFTRPRGEGGMGASRAVALGAMGMMMGESGRWMNPAVFNPNDVDGPSGGSAQWHDVVRGPWAGKLHRLSDLMTFAMLQHADWKDTTLQQAYFKREADGPMAAAWAAMRRAKTAAAALSAGVHRYEVPAHANLEVLKRLPNVATLAREQGGVPRQELGPLDVTIRHHPRTGHPIVTARAGKGMRLGIKTMPTMRPT